MCAPSHEQAVEPDDMPDEGAVLLSAFINGAKEAFDQLVALYHDEGTSFAIWLCHGDVHAAEDIVQEVWLNVSKKNKSFDTTRSFKPWFMRNIRNAFFNQRRKGGSFGKKNARLVPLSDNALDESPGPESIACSNEKVALVRSIINGMHGDYGFLLSHCYLKGYSPREIADMSDEKRTVQNINYHLRNAFVAMKKVVTLRHAALL